MSDSEGEVPNNKTLTSVEDAKPVEAGGPTARGGFAYQDAVAVGFLIEMLKDASLLKVHCETHDDIVLVRNASAGERAEAEFVQVKCGELQSPWSVASASKRSSGPGSSLLETSLARDQYQESSRFRIVTRWPVKSALKVLTFPRGNHARRNDSPAMLKLREDFEKKFPGLKSQKGNDIGYWLENCLWEESGTREHVHSLNFANLARQAEAEGCPLLQEQVEAILEEFAGLVKEAGDAQWEPDREKKIIARSTLRDIWEARLEELKGASRARSGGKLEKKMKEASLPGEVISLAKEMRLDYSRAIRTSKYMDDTELDGLPLRVKSSAMNLRAGLISGEIDADGPTFHSMCLGEMDAINNEVKSELGDQSAFLKGCMYDIADRCLLRFNKPSK